MTQLDIQSLKTTLQDRDPGPFHFPEIYGADWDRLYIGDKVKLGHAFLNAVRAGKLPGVIDTGTKKGGGRLYLWKPRGL
ncbi:single-stranded DNA-binding protein [Thalassospira sp. MA62]|nr:single-stranded DNA-binding protein [Thalassospira sp. MA62]